MKTTETYIKQANLVHGNKYDYSKTEYNGSKLKVCIICHETDDNGNEHGEFWQEANSHLKGCGCPKCNGTFLKSTEDFIKEAKEKFGDKYIYDETIYVNSNTKVCIKCPIHGYFYVSPNNHLYGRGCPECSKLKRYGNEEYISKAKSVYGDMYDYSKTEYVNARTKIKVICKKHGEFEIAPSKHLHGQGCQKCAIEKRKKDLSDFVNESNIIHNYKYNYDKSVYIGSKDKIEIECPIHGSFFMTPNAHLQGQGCPKCGDEKMAEKSRLGIEKCLERFHEIYGDKYDYSEWNKEYKSIETVIPIKCEQHGIFYKTIRSHLNGHGCPKCQSSILENSIRVFLEKHNIKFEEQKKFDWLRYNKNGQMSLDFYLPKYNIAIECQGEQHFKPIEYFGGLESFNKQVERDKLKNELCKNNGILVLYFSNKKYENNIITNKKELLKEIKKYE